jgi:hypothetical protein
VLGNVTHTDVRLTLFVGVDARELDEGIPSDLVAGCPARRPLTRRLLAMELLQRRPQRPGNGLAVALGKMDQFHRDAP